MNRIEAEKIKVGDRVRYFHSSGVVTEIIPTSSDPRVKVPLFRLRCEDPSLDGESVTYLLLSRDMGKAL